MKTDSSIKDFTKDFAKEEGLLHVGPLWKQYQNLDRPLQFTKYREVLMDDNLPHETRSRYKKSLWKHHKEAFLQMKKFLLEHKDFWDAMKKERQSMKEEWAKERAEVARWQKWDEEHLSIHNSEDVPEDGESQ